MRFISFFPFSSCDSSAGNGGKTRSHAIYMSSRMANTSMRSAITDKVDGQQRRFEINKLPIG